MTLNSLMSRCQTFILVCAISFGVIQACLSLSVDNDRSVRIRSKRWVPYGGHIEEPVTPPVVGGSKEGGQRSRRSYDARQGPGVNTTTTPTTTTSTTTASTVTPTTNITVTSTTQPPAGTQQPMVNISDFLAMNYSYTDQTSFENGTNGWDFIGTWSKTNLSAADVNKLPVPLPMPGTLANTSRQAVTEAPTNASSSTNATTEPDQNNFVMIYTVDEYSPKGLLQKSFDRTANGEAFIRYYVVFPNTEFNVTLVRQDKSVLLYSSAQEGDKAIVKEWTARRVKFTEEQTLNKGYTLLLSVIAPKDRAQTLGEPVLAVQHIAVGGMWPGGTPPTIPGPSNETVSPPGSAPYLEGIASSIYTALYVFLAFFLLLIIALVVVVVRGRLR